MFSCINFPEFVHEKEPIDGKIEPVGKNEETIKKNTEQLHRMVLGKDQNIDAKYVQTFYNDISQGVSIASRMKCLHFEKNGLFQNATKPNIRYILIFLSMKN